MTGYRVIGADRLARRLSRLARAADTAIAQELAAAGARTAAAARTHLESGAVKPVSRTGALARSVEVDATAREVRVGTPLAYGAHLEYGTRAMPAYPWLGPAFRLVSASLRSCLRSALKNAVGGGRP